VIKIQVSGNSVADPGSGALLTPGSGMGKNQDLGSGSGMNNPNHISETILGENTSILDADPGWKKFGSGINIPDPQH
jgi:hypothetical protein